MGGAYTIALWVVVKSMCHCPYYGEKYYLKRLFVPTRFLSFTLHGYDIVGNIFFEEKNKNVKLSMP